MRRKKSILIFSALEENERIAVAWGCQTKQSELWPSLLCSCGTWMKRGELLPNCKESEYFYFQSVPVKEQKLLLQH